MRLQVDWNPDRRLLEAPESFQLGENRVKVAEVLDRWLDPQISYFKLLSQDGAVYILRLALDNWSWELTMFAKEQHVTPGGSYGSVQMLTPALNRT